MLEHELDWIWMGTQKKVRVITFISLFLGVVFTGLMLIIVQGWLPEQSSSSILLLIIVVMEADALEPFTNSRRRPPWNKAFFKFWLDFLHLTRARVIPGTFRSLRRNPFVSRRRVGNLLIQNLFEIAGGRVLIQVLFGWLKSGIRSFRFVSSTTRFGSLFPFVLC
mmetsp:Transcript_20259/g.54018  ORF Transcript_20259/g.54018 Transcript_20259/m.54018 type:complete len:165 (-) Transcript_20259:2651-3145(-)